MSLFRHGKEKESLQLGKPTLARVFVPADSINCFDLEDAETLARLSEPNTALRPLRGLVVIDEIERRPDLFPFFIRRRFNHRNLGSTRKGN
jgi:hypothetical protein